MNHFKKTFPAIMMTFLMIPQALAGTYLFENDCNTADIDTKVGIVSDPNDPNNGPEIIAFRMVLDLVPSGSTTTADIEDARLEVSSSLNAVVAKNTSNVEGNKVVLEIEGGFTGQTGVINNDSVFRIRGIREKSYDITVVEGELYEKNNTDNSFSNNPVITFSADPADCDANNTSNSSNNQNNSNTSNNNQASNSNSNTQQQTGTTSISLDSEPSSAAPGEEVVVTASIQHLNGLQIDWTQTAGSPITPDLVNTDLDPTNPGVNVKSVVTFDVPSNISSNETITLRVVIGSTAEEINIPVVVAGSSAGTSTDEGDLRGAATTDDAAQELRDRLAQRRQEALEASQQNAASETTTDSSNASESGNIHGAAGALAQSGPADTLFLMMLALLTTGLMSKFRSKDPALSTDQS